MFVEVNKKLRKTSSETYQELEPSDKGGKTYQWRRNFNFLLLRLKNIKVIHSFNIHNKEFDFEFIEHGSINDLKPNIKTTFIITGDLDEDHFKDSIYVAKQSKEEKEISSIEYAKGHTKIQLKSGLPTNSENENFPTGIYCGSVCRVDFRDEDYLSFELLLPVEQLIHLISELRTDENSSIEVGAILRSYTHEIDDFTLEFHNSRSFLIDELSQCFITSVGIVSNIGQHTVKVESEEYSEPDFQTYEKILTEDQINQRRQLTILESYEKPIKSALKALWIITIVLILQLFTR